MANRLRTTSSNRLMVTPGNRLSVGCGDAAPCVCPGGLPSAYTLTGHCHMWEWYDVTAAIAFCDNPTGYPANIYCDQEFDFSVPLTGGTCSWNGALWVVDVGVTCPIPVNSLQNSELVFALSLITTAPCRWRIATRWNTHDHWEDFNNFPASDRATKVTPAGAYPDAEICWQAAGDADYTFRGKLTSLVVG